MTASRPEGAKEVEEERIAVAVHGERFVAGVCRTSGVLMSPCKSCQRVATLCVEYAREQVEAANQTCKDHKFKLPPATCCYVGDTITFWDKRFVDAVNEDEAVITDLRAQLQTLRGEHERPAQTSDAGMPLEARMNRVLQSSRSIYDGDLGRYLATEALAYFRDDKAALEARERALREALELMISPETDWENGETGVGYRFREIARNALAPRPRHE